MRLIAGRLIYPVILLFCGVPFVQASPAVKVLKFWVTNSSDQPREHENIVLKVRDLVATSAEFNPASFIITTNDASTLDQDWRALETIELPSQVDDLDGDGKPDEIAFQIPLRARQSRIISVFFGGPGFVARLRGNYILHTRMVAAPQSDSLTWESDLYIWTLHPDNHSAIDLIGKRRPGISSYEFLRDTLRPQSSMFVQSLITSDKSTGIGSFGVLEGGHVITPDQAKEHSWRILSAGPVRSISEAVYGGWTIDSQQRKATVRIMQWAHERGFEQVVSFDGTAAVPLVVALPRRTVADDQVVQPSSGSPVFVRSTWGPLQPGGPAAGDQSLGIAVLALGAESKSLPDSDENLLVQPQLLHDGARWYTVALWDQEGKDNLVLNTSDPANMRLNGSVHLVTQRPTREDFNTLIASESSRLAQPARVALVSNLATPQPAPPDTLAPTKQKSIQDAIDLMRQAADRTATKWQPLIARPDPDAGGRETGIGFFAEGDQTTGEWTRQDGNYRGGAFWAAELWMLYSRTADDRYKNWAISWSDRLIGKTLPRNQDGGLIHFYSSTKAHAVAKNPKYLGDALQAAERLKDLYNPTTQLVSDWGPAGDDTVIDDLMDLQMWWWAADETGDLRWRSLGLNHALKTAAWLVRDDGSVSQSVHYNPGDNRQRFTSLSPEPQSILVDNNARPGEAVFTHTHQGFAADTTWSRGQAWAIYGFTIAFQETKNSAMLTAAESTAGFAIEHLPDDGVPWYDFVDEGVHFRNRDSATAAIIASGLLRLSELEPDANKAANYRKKGEEIVRSLINRYLTPVGASDRTPPGVLRHGCSTRPRDGMLIYGDYYLLEALFWLQDHKVT